MDLDYGKLWISGAAALVGAIAGAFIWAQVAAARAQQAAQAAGEDALIIASRSVGLGSFAAALKGAGVGAIIGVVVAIAYFYFTDPNHEMRIREVDTGDDRY